MADCNGILIPDSDLISGRIRGFLESGMYELPEAKALDIRDGDRVLELGVGIGYIATLILQDPKLDAYLGIEANPQLIPLIHETFRLNGVSGDVLNCAVGGSEIYLHQDFWASSIDGDGERVVVDCCDLQRVIDEFRPTLIVCDIEGAERFLADMDLSGVERLLMEMHLEMDIPGFVADKRGSITLWSRDGQERTEI